MTITVRLAPESLHWTRQLQQDRVQHRRNLLESPKTPRQAGVAIMETCLLPSRFAYTEATHPTFLTWPGRRKTTFCSHPEWITQLSFGT